MGVIDYKLLTREFEKSGMTATKLAEKMNVSRNTIYNIMQGKASPSYYIARTITEALEICGETTLEIFFSNAKPKQTKPLKDEEEDY